mgnify:CR=1 FL=1
MVKKEFFPKLHRKLIQVASFGFTNPFINHFFSGKLYTGKLKSFCSPGLNCYSCPAAAFSCPIGALQAVSTSKKFSVSFYVIGFLLALGTILGRAVCAFLCPFGLLQELLNKIPSPKFKLWKPLRYVKFAILLLFVLILPVADTNYAGVGDPTFCKYICPQGTFEAALPLLTTHQELHSALGILFFIKLAILICVLILCIFCHRFFCKLLCPLGAIYGLCNKFSILKLSVNKESCIKCGKCTSTCKMEVDPKTNPNSIECIRCGECTHVCPVHALKLEFHL